MNTERTINAFLENAAMRRVLRIAAFSVLGASLGVLIAHYSTLSPAPIVEVVPRSEEMHSTGMSAYVLYESVPMTLSIPDIDLTAPFEEPLGLNPDRSPEVPDSYTKVGWYKYSPTPGELGPSVILGHVDSRDGPAVFFSIGQLARGDPIEITREDGSVAVFRVTGIERYEQEGFPSELVYGNIDHAGLRLVTCSGTYNRKTDRYSHNTVVYATLDKASTTAANRETGTTTVPTE